VEAERFLRRLLGGPLTFGSAVEAIRQGEGLTQTQLAARLGVTKSHLCDIERGRKLVSPERAARFAKVLGYSPEQFVQMVLQEALDRAGLRYKVKLRAA
jgi:transcriptional regulator with XRE-family HTH domain